jgi:DNA-binding transcriptional LysR family regulator
MDRLQAMKVLLEAVDAGSLSAAGRRLAIPLATVSRRVSELEDYLGSTRAMRLATISRSAGNTGSPRGSF